MTAVRDKYLASVAVATAVMFGFGIVFNPSANANQITEDHEAVVYEGAATLDPDFVAAADEAPVAVATDVEFTEIPDEVIDNGTTETVVFNGGDAVAEFTNDGLDGLGESEEIVVVAAGETEPVDAYSNVDTNAFNPEDYADLENVTITQDGDYVHVNGPATYWVNEDGSEDGLGEWEHIYYVGPQAE